jgi:hypothetical protein
VGLLDSAQGLEDSLIEELFDALGIWDSIEDSFGVFDKSYTSGYEYYMGMHLGVCHGPVDEILEVKLDGRTAWKGVARPGEIAEPDALYNRGIPTQQENADEEGVVPVTRPDQLAINQEHLFGGEKANGGVLGVIDVMTGVDSQEANTYLQNKCGTRVPAWVGFLTLVFHSNLTSKKDYVYDSFWLGPIGRHVRRAKLSEPPTYHTGFYWAAMQPAVRAPSVKVFRALLGWHGTPVFYPEKCIITLQNNVRHINGAHIVYQILTNKRIGMKKPYTLVDDENFRAVADQLYEEGFGLSYLWTGKDSIETYLGTVLRTLNAELFQNPATGLYQLFLIRKASDVELSEAPHFTPDEMEGLGEYYQPGWSETVNDLTILYLSPDGERVVTASDQNAANIAIQGCTVSDSMPFYGIRDKGLADRVLARELMMASTPLKTLTQVPLSRLQPYAGTAFSSAFTLHRGALIRLSIPKYRLENAAFRVAGIHQNSLTDTRIIVDLIEDVFSLPHTGSVGSVSEGWVDPVRPAEEFPEANVRYAPLSYHTVLQLMGAAGAAYLNPEYAGFSIIADRPEGMDQVNGVTVYGADVDNILAATQLSPTSMLCPTCLLDGALDIHDGSGNLITTIVIKDINSLSLLGVIGCWGFIDDEKILCVDVDDDPESPTYLTMTVERGVLDTVPAAHDDSAKIWWFNDIAGSRIVGAAYLKGEQPYLWATSNSSIDQAALSATTPKFHPTLVADWYAPYPPANVTFEGVRFRENIGARFEMQISGRNRLTQSNQFLAWDESGTEPESGTTLEVRVYDADTLALLDTITGIPFLGPEGYFKYEGTVASNILIQSQTVRSGVKSPQIYEHEAKVCGYGWGYGCLYGGNNPNGVFLTVPGTLYDGSRQYASDKISAPYPKFVGGRWWDTGGVDAAGQGLLSGPGVQFVARVGPLGEADGTAYHLPISEGHPSHAAPVSGVWVEPPTHLQTVEALSYAWPTYQMSINSTYTDGRYGRVYRAPAGQQRASMTQIVAIPDAVQGFLANNTAKLELHCWFGTDTDGTPSADVGRIYAEFLDQDFNVLSFVDTTPTDIFDTGWLDAETDALFLHDSYQGGRWRPVDLTIPADPDDHIPAGARYVRMTFLCKNLSSPNCISSFNLISGRIMDVNPVTTDALEVATVSNTAGFPVEAKLQGVSQGWAVMTDGIDGWAASSAGRIENLNLPVAMNGAGVDPVCNSMIWTQVFGGSWLVNVNAGSNIVTIAELENPELFDFFDTDIWEGGLSTAEPISTYAEITWIGQIDNRILAVGNFDAEEARACIYKSRKQVTANDFVLGEFELVSDNLDPAFADINNWVYYPPESRWYVFGTSGSLVNGKLTAWRSSDGLTWTKVAVTTRGNTVRMSRPFLRRTGASSWVIEIYGGAYLFKYDGAWTRVRATLNPYLMGLFATAGGTQWDPDDVDLYLSDASADHNSIMLRTGRVEWNASTDTGNLGQYYAGSVLGFDTLDIGQDLTAVTLVSPVDHPYGKMVATCGDLSADINSAGFVNNSARVDVAGLYGRNTGKRYYEAVVSAQIGSTQLSPLVFLGLALAAGPTETCKAQTSVIINASGDVYTKGRFQCPGLITLGTTKVATGFRIAAGATLGFKVDFAAKSIRVFLDGQLIATVSGSTLDTGKIWFPILTVNGLMATFNLGQTTFIFDPNTGGDTGYVGWI